MSNLYIIKEDNLNDYSWIVLIIFTDDSRINFHMHFNPHNYFIANLHSYFIIKVTIILMNSSFVGIKSV